MNDGACGGCARRPPRRVERPGRARCRRRRCAGRAAAVLAVLAFGVAGVAAARTLELSETALTLPEGGSAAYTVRLTALPTADVEVSIGGASGTDLSLNPAELTFTTSTWSTARTVTVSADGDDDALHDRSTLTHAAAGGGYGTATADLPVTVTDTTRLPLTVVVEGLPEGASTPIRATLPMPVDDDMVVTVAVTPDNARADEYELSAERTLTIAAGATQSTGEVVFTSFDDFEWTGTRLFYATVSADHPRVDPDTGALRVYDDDQTGVRWRVAPEAVFENGGTAVLTAFKDQLHGHAVKLRLSLEPAGLATLSGGTLTFEPGAIYATEALTIAAVDDAAADGDRTVTVTATATGGRGFRTPAPLPLTIVDDDGVAATVALKLSPPRVREGLASLVTAHASHALDAEATITVTAAPGHADTLASDFALSADTVLTIPAGGMRSTGAVSVAAVDDSWYAGGRRREVTVGGALVGGGGVSGPADLTLTVLEDDAPVPVPVIATPGTIWEGETSTITLRTRQPMPADATVTVSTSSDAVG